MKFEVISLHDKFPKRHLSKLQSYRLTLKDVGLKNHAYVHLERLDALLELMNDLGLPVTLKHGKWGLILIIHDVI